MCIYYESISTHSGVRAAPSRNVTFPGLYVSLVSTFLWHSEQVVVTGNGSKFVNCMSKIMCGNVGGGV